ncbi:Uncharacterized protein Adt_13685 [Abeliophyllum distichum]|uniref:Uncharacterized protein n=1 Tax=Abeliophyllum distichum TaxID=126358 RepID=A0ABD1TXI1_9LAMI
MVGKVYSMVLQEEKQRDLTISREVQTTAFKKFPIGESSQNKAKGKMYCSHCRGINHTIDCCFYLHGFPPGHRYHKRNERQAQGMKVNYISPNNAQDANTLSFTPKQNQHIMALLSESNGELKANISGQNLPKYSISY